MTASERIRLNRASRRLTRAVADLREAKEELDAASREYEEALYHLTTPEAAKS